MKKVKKNGYMGWLVLSFAMVLCTLVFDSQLLDSSNIVRFLVTSFFSDGELVVFRHEIFALSSKCGRMGIAFVIVVNATFYGMGGQCARGIVRIGSFW